MVFLSLRGLHFRFVGGFLSKASVSVRAVYGLFFIYVPVVGYVLCLCVRSDPCNVCAVSAVPVSASGTENPKKIRKCQWHRKFSPMCELHMESVQ